jgi:hypothetical protein
MSDPPPPYNGPLTFLDYWEILRLPVLLALAAIAGTWAVWYFTSVPCRPDLTQTTDCYSSEVTRYIHLNLLNKMMTHAVIAGGGGGLWSYAMITRERRAREAERKAREAVEKQLAEERERAAEEREKAAEEREKAAEERRQLLDTIELLTERLAESGNAGNGRTL